MESHNLYRVKEEDLDKLATAAFADVCTPGNPREVSKEIILELYKKALSSL